MNKEECLKALEKIENDEYLIAEDDEGDLIHIVNLYKNELKTLRYLIHEYFDNPSLKFEELKESEVYWHVYYGWIMIESIHDYECIVITTLGGAGYETLQFEEDCFYKKQVEE